MAVDAGNPPYPSSCLPWRPGLRADLRRVAALGQVLSPQGEEAVLMVVLDIRAVDLL